MLIIQYQIGHARLALAGMSCCRPPLSTAWYFGLPVPPLPPMSNLRDNTRSMKSVLQQSMLRRAVHFLISSCCVLQPACTIESC
jgi:hypothetical protein